jgi:uncharacterized caspase-like protein
MSFAGLRALFVAGMSLLAMSVDALADKRVALVIGNSAYQNVAKLPNPARDASSIADMLKNAGFDSVSLQQDAGNLEFKRAIRRFEDAARDADVAVIFYAGHGIEIGGVNYMIPVDAKLASDLDAQDEAITLERIVESVETAKQLRLVILDACRDNPFVATMKRQRTAALRGVSAGLGKVEPTSSGTLVAYAAKAGSTADDGIGEHSPFTTALLKHLTAPGLDIRLAFGQVRDEVMKITNQRQEPFVYGSLGGATVSLVRAPESAVQQAAATPPTATDPISEARRDYEYFERVGTKDAWDAFLNLHSTGPYADLARAQRARIMASDPAKSRSPVVAAVTSPPRPDAATATPPPGPAPGEVARMLQTELARVGCYSGAISGDWSTASRRALDAFNRNANVKLDSKTANVAALDAVREKQARVCPLECDRGFRAEDNQCVKIACESGFAANDKGNCEPVKNQPQTTTRTPAAEPAKRQPAARADAGAKAGGQQVACDRFGCRQVGKGCHVETSIFREETQQSIICR